MLVVYLGVGFNTSLLAVNGNFRRWGLLRQVENAAALRAVDDFLGGADEDGGLSGNFHVAAHTDFMFESCDGGAVFIFEEVEVNFEDILIDEFCESLVFGF